MSVIRRRIPHTKKPSGPVKINWGHPLAKGLVGAWIFNDPSNLTIRDLVANNNATIEDMTPNWRIKDGEMQHEMEGTATDGVITVPSSARLNPSDSISIAVRINTPTGDGGTGTNQGIILNEPGQYALTILDSGDIEFNDFDVADLQFDPGPFNGVNHDILCTVDDQDNSEIFYDGISRDTGSTNRGGSSAGELNIGNEDPPGRSRGLNGSISYVYIYDRPLNSKEAKQLHSNPWQFLEPRTQIIGITSAVATAVLTGTATATIDEADLVTGGKTIIVTLTGDTFKAAGTGPIGSTADTQALIDGFDAASSPTNGWNNEVRDKALTSEVVRTSDTVATWTIGAQAGYDISAQETITGTIPTDVLVTAAGAIIATPTFTVDQVVAGRIMSSLANHGGLAGFGGIAGIGGGLAG
ncbi:MAG: LamG-like jellyroll fold domain-containing protein [Nitrosomonadaceae bacterium]